jgi:hypothetical protein
LSDIGVVIYMPESDTHRALKQLLESKMKEWLGASIQEYPSSGHELDVFAITSSGVSVHIEIIWSHSKTRFLSDINMLQQSDAQAKLVVVSPMILADKWMTREFEKVVLAQRKQGKTILGDMLDGQRILKDSEYVDFDLRSVFENLVMQTRPASETCPICGTAKIPHEEWEPGVPHPQMYAHDPEQWQRVTTYRCPKCEL